jgi:hypothetical protein
MRSIYYYTILLFIIIGCCMGTYAETVTIPSITLQQGEKGTVEIYMDQAPQGLSGYTLIVEAQGSATITGGEGPAWASLKNADMVGNTLSVSVVDLMDEVKPGATQILLATIAITGGTGKTTLTLTVKQMDDDNGNAIVPVVIPGQITSGSSEPAVVTQTPTSTPTPRATTSAPVPTTTIPTPLPTTLQTAIPTSIPTTIPTTLIPSTSVPATVAPTPIPTAVQTTIPTTQIPSTPPPQTPIPAPTTVPESQKHPMEVEYTLSAGWNLIGIPAQPVTGYETATVFSHVPSEGHSMFQYGASGWEKVNPTTPLHAMDAYWVYADIPFTVTIQVQERSGSKSLQSGWNLISPAGFTAKKASEAFNSISWSYIIRYDGEIQQYDIPLILGADDAIIVEPGQGYWIYLSNAETLSF